MSEPNLTGNHPILFQPVLSKRMLALLVWGLCISALLVAFPQMGQTPIGLVLWIGAVLLCLIYLPSLYYFVFSDRLMMTDTGINYQIKGVNGTLAWDNISRIRRWRNTSGLQLHTPIEKPSQPYARLSYMMHFRQGFFVPISHIVSVPDRFPLFGNSDLYWEKFRNTDFGQLLEEHIPDIFELPYPIIK